MSTPKQITLKLKLTLSLYKFVCTDAPCDTSVVGEQQPQLFPPDKTSVSGGTQEDSSHSSVSGGHPQQHCLPAPQRLSGYSWLIQVYNLLILS